MATTAQDIQRQAEQRLKEVEAQIKQSEDAISGLKDERKTLSAMLKAAPASRRGRRSPGTSTAAAPSRKRAKKRAPRGQRQQQLLEAAKKKPEARPADLAKIIGVSDSQAHALISKSKKEKKLSRPGGKWKVAAG